MAWFDLTVPGYSVVPTQGGPDVFLNVFGLNWTDQQGLRRTTDALFLGRAGQTAVDFHFPFTVPIVFGNGAAPARMTIHAVFVTFHMPSGLVTVDRIRVFDRLALIFDTLPGFGQLGLSSPTAFSNSTTLNRNLHSINGPTISKSIGVTVTVSFGSGSGAGGLIGFTGAGISLQS
jgi:hypothetical protein